MSGSYDDYPTEVIASRQLWEECSHADEPCRCDELLTCICKECCRKRWPNGPDDA